MLSLIFMNFKKNREKKINMVSRKLIYLHCLSDSQLKFTCSKSTTENLEKVWSMFKITNENTKTTSLTSI